MIKVAIVISFKFKWFKQYKNDYDILYLFSMYFIVDTDLNIKQYISHIIFYIPGYSKNGQRNRK